MGRRQSGGNTSAVKEIMIENLCRETRNGDTLKNKDSNSFVQVQNLCSTSNKSSSIESEEVVRQNNTATENKNTSGSNNSTFSGGNIVSNISSLMFFPMRKAFGAMGFDTDKLTETAKNKVNSMLNKNVEQKVQEDENVKQTVVAKTNLEEKIVDKLENLSGGRRRTKKGKGKGKARGKGKGNKSVKRRRNRTKRR